jgi:hypothetical protein
MSRPDPRNIENEKYQAEIHGQITDDLLNYRGKVYQLLHIKKGVIKKRHYHGLTLNDIRPLHFFGLIIFCAGIALDSFPLMFLGFMFWITIFKG